MTIPDISALIGSRICHDLISPIGAIGNGVELLDMAGEIEGPEMALIRESVENANGRIRFFRIAFGAAGPDQQVSRSEITAILGEAPRGGRLSYFWGIDGDPQRRDVRLAFLILQCFETALPHGGDIRVERDGGDWQLRAEATKLLIDPDLWQPLQNDARAPADIKAAHVQFLLLPQALAEYERSFDLQITEDRIIVRFSSPEPMG